MRTISIIGARVTIDDLSNKGWYNVMDDAFDLPYGMNAYPNGDGYVLGYVIYDSEQEVSENNTISVETLFDLIDEFAHETNITKVNYITITL